MSCTDCPEIVAPVMTVLNPVLCGRVNYIKNMYINIHMSNIKYSKGVLRMLETCWYSN